MSLREECLLVGNGGYVWNSLVHERVSTCERRFKSCVLDEWCFFGAQQVKWLVKHWVKGFGFNSR